MFPSFVRSPPPPPVRPFSAAGKRKCMGDNLAKMELFIVVSNLLQRFRFRAQEGATLPDVSEATMGVTLVPPHYKMIAEKL